MSTQIGDSTVDENLAIIADLSNSSNMMTLERLPVDLRKGIDTILHSHCYRVAEQGVIMVKVSVINELRMYDLPRHSKSTATFVDELINKKKCRFNSCY